jgi:RHS repeat-associated protein
MKYGYNGQEVDKDLWEGAVVYEFRISDPRLGRFFSVDPLAPLYPWYTPYQVAGNTPIWAIELEGLEPQCTNDDTGDAAAHCITETAEVTDTRLAPPLATKSWTDWLVQGVIEGIKCLPIVEQVNDAYEFAKAVVSGDPVAIAIAVAGLLLPKVCEAAIEGAIKVIKIVGSEAVEKVVKEATEKFDDVPATSTRAQSELLPDATLSPTISSPLPEPKGGVYSLKDGDGNVQRTGRSNDLERREKEHNKGAETGELEFQIEYKTDVYDEQRGLEDYIHNKYDQPKLNKVKPIADKNPRIHQYKDAAEEYLKKKERQTTPTGGRKVIPGDQRDLDPSRH